MTAHDLFPLTDTQQAYLVGRGDLYELGNVSTHAYLELEGPLDAGRFVLAWRRLVDRHAMLRAVVAPEGQRVLPEVPDPPIEIVDLRGEAEPGDALAAVRERLSHEVRPAGSWPLFSVVVCLLGDGVCRVHVGFDGLTVDWASWHVMYRDLSAYYEDPDAALPPITESFRDHVLAAESGPDEEDTAYWRERLATLPDAPALPLARDPATVARPRFTRRETHLDAPTWGRLKERAAGHGITPTGALLAAYAEVLGRWGGGERFTLNVPSMNRDPLRPATSELVGEFASFILVEADLRPDTFRERAKLLQRDLLEGLEHREFGGVRLLRELARVRGGGEPARMPVVLTSTLAMTGKEPHLLERALTHVYGITQTPQVHLDAQVEERRGALACNWDAVEELFPSGLLDVMFTAWTGLLTLLAGDDAAWGLDDLDLLPAAQAERRDAAQGPVRPIPDEPVHEAFLRQAAARPGAPAVISPAGGTLTYGALLRRAARLSRLLDVEKGARVALLLDKGEDQVVAAFAVLMAGGAYVPLDPETPAVRLRSMLAAADVSVVVAHGSLAPPPGPWRTQRVDRGEDGPSGVPRVEVGADDLAYVLFTSGSSGAPKGVLIEHRGVVNCLLETAERFEVGPGDRCLGLTALHHDMSLFDVFGVLGAGGTLVLPDASRRTDPDHWRDLMTRHGVTVWNSVPAMMEMLLDGPKDGLAGLRLAFLGGDWIPLDVAREFARRAPGATLVSVGGPTETTLWNIWYPVTRLDPSWHGIPYGSPIANTRYHVLDERMRDRPDGVTGEMYCAGAGLARGYLTGPETAAAFVTHPRTGERLFRTGDLGRYRPDGLIEFVGRRDQQVQVRGRRIEPAEVEAALLSHPALTAAAVVPVHRDDGRPGHRGLAAHVVGSASPDELRAYLAERLPAYLVPGRFTAHERLPLTRNGKVDRPALAAAPPPARVPRAATGEHGDPLSELLASVWAEALGVEGVSSEDNFFELGGDSLAGARILVRLREVFPDEELSPRALLATSDVVAMAHALVAKESVPGRMAEIAAIHLRVARLTDDEVAAQLAGEAP
ncbi:amino acid adenylation domain-containing protein [Actinomadura sp. DC4]|uniref:non-ribosomal peptide synthetase n=1 Tax=Actinomadura sp. DC4 TaxID=3055069 RepID=UPI0025AF90DE|nr:amino acid adenylation domain-containing protein [Actinomadura sp. DC4]MDN3356789.1 amino acid adenylation domain-containing protein [Actinomadura sp. DC4]